MIIGTNQKAIESQQCDQTIGIKCKISERLSEEAAEHAVKKFFAILGVNVDCPESVEEFREDLRFGKKMRKVAGHSTLAFVSVVSAAVAYAAWAGIVSYIKH